MSLRHEFVVKSPSFRVFHSAEVRSFCSRSFTASGSPRGGVRGDGERNSRNRPFVFLDVAEFVVFIPSRDVAPLTLFRGRRIIVYKRQ